MQNGVTINQIAVPNAVVYIPADPNATLPPQPLRLTNYRWANTPPSSVWIGAIINTPSLSGRPARGPWKLIS